MALHASSCTSEGEGGELHCSVIKVKMKRLDILWWGYIARMLNYGLRGVLCTSVEARKRIDWTSLLASRPARILKILEGGEGERVDGIDDCRRFVYFYSC